MKFCSSCQLLDAVQDCPQCAKLNKIEQAEQSPPSSSEPPDLDKAIRKLQNELQGIFRDKPVRPSPDIFQATYKFVPPFVIGMIIGIIVTSTIMRIL